jgi:two-component system chemotaxis response regulator CheB
MLKMRTSVLVIDDDEDDYKFIKGGLSQLGLRFSILWSEDAHAAFQLLDDLKANPPKLIILDLNMPIMNGMEALKILVKEYKIPVILYTTSCSADMVQEAKRIGAIDCIKKGTSYADNLKFAKYVSDMLKKENL